VVLKNFVTFRKKTMAENLLDTCTDCTPYQVPACSAAIGIIFDESFAGDTLYYVLTDKFGKQYWGFVEVDAIDYSAFFDFTQFPEQFFNPYAGSMTVQWYTEAEHSNPIESGCSCMVLEMIESNYTGEFYIYCATEPPIEP
jgi:hypothetical protein